MQDVTPVLFLVGIVLVFWLLMVRPQQRRQRELARMQSSLGVGDEVMLTSGVYGTVRALGDEGEAHVEIADGVTIRVVRAAIGQVVPADRTQDDDPTDDPTDDTDVSEES